MLPAAFVALSPLPTLAQVASQQYGYPITDAPSEDLMCYMKTEGGQMLDLARLCGGTPQVATAPSQRQSAGLVFSNIRFVEPSRAEASLGVGLKIAGRMTNQSNRTFRGNIIDYEISAFNGRQRVTVIKHSDWLNDGGAITLAPGTSIPFEHELSREQAAAMRAYILAPDLFAFSTTGVRIGVLDLSWFGSSNNSN